MHVNALRVVDTTCDVAHCDDLTFEFVMEQARCNTANVAEALHDDRAFCGLHPFVAHGFASDDQHTARCSFQATLAATDSQGLARHDCRDGVTGVHGIGIHDPAHDLRVGVHIGGGNVAIGANQDGDFSSVAAREAFEFSAGHFMGIADDAAFRTAKRDGDNGALPRHPHCQGTHFVERDFGSKTDAAFGRAAIDVVLHTITGEHFNIAIIHTHGKVYDKFAFGFA